MPHSLWHDRYVKHAHMSSTSPGANTRPLEEKQPGTPGEENLPLADWVVALPILFRGQVYWCDLVGNTEDIVCQNIAMRCKHEEEIASHTRGRRVLCEQCRVPMCRDCFWKLATSGGKGCVPMAIANDHFYVYACQLLAQESVT